MNDIEVLEKFTKIVKGKDYNAENGWHGYYDDELIVIGKAIENLLTRNKDLEEINEAHKKENGELREEVEEKTEVAEWKLEHAYNTGWKACEIISIPKSLIKEKIEERKLWLSSNDIGYKDDYVLEVLQELLEKRK